MRINEYNSLEEFIFEYCKGREDSSSNNEHKQRFMGIEFKSNGIIYRMCREPFDEKYTPILPNGKPGLYNVMIMHCEKKGYPMADTFESIGWYDSLESMLDSCKLGNNLFKEVIVAEDTEILGKD